METGGEVEVAVDLVKIWRTLEYIEASKGILASKKIWPCTWIIRVEGINVGPSGAWWVLNTKSKINLTQKFKLIGTDPQLYI